MAPDPDEERLRGHVLAWSRWLLAACVVLGLAPLLVFFFGGLRDYVQSPWWYSLRGWVWAGIALVGMTLAFFAVGTYQLANQLHPYRRHQSSKAADRQAIRIGLSVIIFGFSWVLLGQAVALPKVLHALSQPERASVRFVATGETHTRHRRACDSFVASIEGYGELSLCRAPEFKPERGMTGELWGTESAYGFWYDAIYFDEPKQ